MTSAHVQVGTLLPWQASAWQQLMAYVAKQRVPHAFLFSGAKGLGKGHLANCFSQALLCTTNRGNGLGCKRCKSCLLFNAGTHPDLFRVEPQEEGKPIIVDSIRELRPKLSLGSQYDGYRVVLLKPADALNFAAANALLKTLEEPVPKTVLMLVTDAPCSLPITVSSRCQRLTMPLPDTSVALSWLNQKIKNGSNAKILLALANGAPLEALSLAESDGLAQRSSAYKTWLDLAQKRCNPVTAAENWSTLPLQRLLGWLTGWTIDMIRLRHYPEIRGINNPDFKESLQAEAEKLNLMELFNYLDLLLRSGALGNTQVNSQLMLEEILIEWQFLTRDS